MAQNRPSRAKTFQSVCEASGGALVAAALFMIWVPLGLLFLGAALVLVGNMKVGK